MIPLNKNIHKTLSPPIEKAFNWLENIETPKKLKLLNFINFFVSKSFK